MREKQILGHLSVNVKKSPYSRIKFVGNIIFLSE